jgi:uncharacterized protein YndB with AHSA1/START domain
MKVHESLEIAASPEWVWEHIADPQAMADWHAKLVEVRRNSSGPLYVGERFGATYIMSRKKQNRRDSEAEVLRCEPWTALVLRHHMIEKGATGYVDETYLLSPRDEGRATRVEQTVDFANAGLPLWARALMWCITRTGEPSGEGTLDPLKRACEGVGGPSPSA